jgi:hypothetical protein
MFRRFSAAVIAATLVGGLVAVGATPASAADPLTIALPNPGGVTPYAQITLPNATRAHFYSFQMVAQGGQPPYTWERDDFNSSPPVPGLTFSASGLLSGTPPLTPETSVGSAEAFRVTDSADPPNTAWISTRLTVDPFFRIVNSSLPNAVAGQPYSVALTAAGGSAPYTFSKASTFPKGLKLNPRTGQLSGAPKWGGQYSIAVNVEDSRFQPRYTTKTLVLSVAGPTGPGGASGNKKPIINATGDLSCSGPIKMKAAVNGTGTSLSVAAKYTGKLTCQGSTGNPNVRITTALVQGQYSHQGGCSVLGVQSDFGASSIGNIYLTWKATGGKANATTVRYSNHDARSDGWRLPATNPAGTSNVTGSYAGTGGSSAVIGTGAPAALSGMCSGGPQKAQFGGLLLISL